MRRDSVCTSSHMWLWLIHSGIHERLRQVRRRQLRSGLTIPLSPAELAATSIFNWLLVSAFVSVKLKVFVYVKWDKLSQGPNSCGTHVLKMKKPNCLTKSLWISLCLLHLSEQNLTFHVHFHGCLFIHLCCEWTVSLYVFGRTSIQVPVFSSIYGQIAVCFGVLLCSCQLFSKHSSVICLRFHPFQFPFLFYGSTSVHLIECASAGRFILLFFQKHISFFHSSHKPPF